MGKMSNKEKFIANREMYNLGKKGIKLASSYARNFCSRYKIKDSEQLTSYLCEKVADILKKYNTDRGDFDKYALSCFRFYCYNYLRDKSRIIKIPRKYTEMYLKYKAYMKKRCLLDSCKTRLEFCSDKNVHIDDLNESLQACGTKFSEINDYTIYTENDEKYNPNCVTYLAGLPIEVISMLEDIFIQKTPPHLAYLKQGYSTFRGNIILKEHLEQLNILKSE